MAVLNKGRIQNFISGISGITPGGLAVVNLPTNIRVHRSTFQTSAIAYQSPTVSFGGPGTGATATATVVNGQVTALNLTADGSGYTSVPTVTITDSLYTDAQGIQRRVGQGATATATVVAGAVTALTLTSGGVASPTPPELVISSFKEQVNGVNMRDISAANTQRINAANPQNGWVPSAGEFARFYTEPWRNLNQHNEVTSWDLAGQNTWQYQIGIAANVTQPSIVGAYEFDYERNTRPQTVGGKVERVPFLQPVRHHQYSFPVGAGRFDLTTLPWDFPIGRLWMYETDLNTGARLGVGSIYQVELYQDGNKVMENTLAQNQQTLAEYGFNYNIFDAAFVSDPDQRLFKALHVQKQLILRVYSTTAANLNVVIESLPGAFQ